MEGPLNYYDGHRSCGTALDKVCSSLAFPHVGEGKNAPRLGGDQSIHQRCSQL